MVAYAHRGKPGARGLRAAFLWWRTIARHHCGRRAGSTGARGCPGQATAAVRFVIPVHVSVLGQVTCS